MYFDSFKTEVEIKERYRTLAKKLHPDVGGDKIIMQEINLEYQKALDTLKSPPKQEKPRSHYRPPEYVDDDDETKIAAVLKWAEENPDFDTSFIDSLDDWLSKGRDLTDAQETALNRIIKRFRINIKDWS